MPISLFYPLQIHSSCEKEIVYEDRETKEGKIKVGSYLEDYLEGIASLPEGSLALSDTISYTNINVHFTSVLECGGKNCSRNHETFTLSFSPSLSHTHTIHTPQFMISGHTCPCCTSLHVTLATEHKRERVSKNVTVIPCGVT